MSETLFKPIRGFFATKAVTIDNNIFKFHYRITVVILFFSFLLVTTKQFFGNPIYCVSNNAIFNEEALNHYCWIFGTFTVEQDLKGVVAKTPYYGVGPSSSKDRNTHHTYYQWVHLAFFLQAAMFYLPRLLWKTWEGGKVKLLCEHLMSPIITHTEGPSRQKKLINYLNHTDLQTHNFYGLRFALCEFLNLVNVISQIYFLDMFLGGSFRSYGAAVAAFNRNPNSLENIDPMEKFFPKMTKCTFYSYGPSGGIQNQDYLCILTLNTFNEKLFVLIWFWFLILTMASMFAFIYRILIYAFPSLRMYMLMAQVRHVPKSTIRKIVEHCHVGDWFLLNLLGKNLNPVVFKDVLLELGKSLKEKVITV